MEWRERGGEIAPQLTFQIGVLWLDRFPGVSGSLRTEKRRGHIDGGAVLGRQRGDLLASAANALVEQHRGRSVDFKVEEGGAAVGFWRLIIGQVLSTLPCHWHPRQCRENDTCATVHCP